MANPPLVTLPFASSGDQSIPPPSSAQGFVNFTSGYTPDYEISLTSGDPQAKAVERAVQNFLFNIATANIQAWQTTNRPPWYNNMPGGYSKYAEVVFPDLSGNPVPYRSLKAGNVASPAGGLGANWEYIQGTGEMIANIPMPSGGPAGPGSYLYTVSVDFNTLTSSGSFQFATDAVVSGSPNNPQNGGNKAGAGMLEVNAWAASGSTYVTQLFRDRTGLAMTRGSTNGSWTIWKIWANATQFVVGEIRHWSGTATQAAVTAAWGPGWHLCDGTLGTPNLQDRFVIGASGSRAVGSAGGAGSVALDNTMLPVHNHPVYLSDPGHNHGLNQSAHGHGFSDPGHGHGLYWSDPGHGHGVNWSDPGHAHSHPAGGWCQAGQDNGGCAALSPPNQYGANGNVQNTNPNGTGISMSIQGSGSNISASIYGNGTGCSVQAGYANLSLNASGTGMTASSGNAGSGNAVPIIPPYLAFAYVMYTGA